MHLGCCIFAGKNNSMQDNLFLNRYRLQSARAAWHAYNGGMYFVTICTKNREHYFGEIENGEIHLSEIGEYTQICIQHTHEHNPYAEIPLWVVMPNHIHAIVVIDGDKIPYDKRTIKTTNGGMVETFHETSLQEPIKIATQMQSWLSVVVRLCKQSITRYANEHAITFVWQPRFYDHIIRNIGEMNRIAGYIEQNVAKWECDELNGLHVSVDSTHQL